MQVQRVEFRVASSPLSLSRSLSFFTLPIRGARQKNIAFNMHLTYIRSALASIMFFVHILVVAAVVVVALPASRSFLISRFSSFIGALLLLALASFVIVAFAALRFSCPNGFQMGRHVRSLLSPALCRRSLTHMHAALSLSQYECMCVCMYVCFAFFMFDKDKRLEGVNSVCAGEQWCAMSAIFSPNLAVNTLH